MENEEYNSDNCISGIQLFDYVDPGSGMSHIEKGKIRRHLEKCEHCRGLVIKAQGSVESIVEKVKKP